MNFVKLYIRFIQATGPGFQRTRYHAGPMIRNTIADVVRGDMPLSHWKDAQTGFILDVREPIELAVEKVPEALNIPLGQLRARLGELPRDREINVVCRSGQRAYYATRILLQNGFKAKIVSGGMLSLAHNQLIDGDKVRE